MKKTSALLLAFALSFGFVACGGDDEGGSSSASGSGSGTEETTTTTEGGDEESTTTTAGEDGGDETTTTESEDGGGDVAVSDEVCADLEALNALDGGDEESVSLDDVDEVRGLIDDLIADADADLAEAAQLFLDFINAVVAEAEANGTDFDTAAEAVFTDMGEDDGAAFFAASETITAAETACGIED